uniref:Uncharacterized protein n=1 Tax=Anopheles christyi TaxID=43041 RepID=A0A182KIX2_9DIPT
MNGFRFLIADASVAIPVIVGW